MYFIKDKQTVDFLVQRSRGFLCLFKKSLPEIQVLKCSGEIGITYINQKDKTNFWEISKVRIEVFTRKLTSVASLRITYQETS